MTPVAHRVVGCHRETDDVTTLRLAPLEGVPMAFRSGQFNMVTAFGIGEAALSVSSAPDEGVPLQHTVRDIGPVTHALCGAQVGDLVGVRGPFGTDWGVGTATGPGNDVVVVAGGIGLAPLRGAVRELLDRQRQGGGRVFVIVGAREPAQIIFPRDLEAWARGGARLAVTVDVPGPQWAGHVGLVTSLLDQAGFDPSRAAALVCGPEIMMRFTARALIAQGVDPDRILVSLERNMQCAVAWCGHCQLGPYLLCRDGPVLPYAGAVAHLLSEREL
ncbi:MAG: FAD/NAD(P)-binding protein [Acidimicrobiales bacterium]|jgi:NAD(P)H-flavin reductase